MDFAITPTAGEAAWVVVGLRELGAGEVAVPLASFGHRGHAEAFLADFLSMVDDAAAHAVTDD